MASSENTAINDHVMHTTLPVTMPVAAPFEAQRSEWIEPTQLVNPHHRERFVGTLKLRHPDLRITIGKLALTMVLLMGAGIFIGSYVVFSGQAGNTSNQAITATVAKIAPVPTAIVDPAATKTPEPAATGKPEPAPPRLSNHAATPAGGEPPTPVDTAAKAAMLVDVRIDSTPSGATVTLVDRGKSQFVGKTPVNATLDTSREYDLVFTFPNKATQQKHLNASTTRRIAVTLPEQVNAQPAPAVAPAVAPATAPRHVEKAIVEKPPASPVKKASAEPGPASAVKKPGKAAGEPVLGEGTLMVSSKPPCQIVIDGKPTGLTTPQRSITLSAGNHKVTLINSERDIKKTVSVQITANGTEKVIEDLMP